MKIQNKRYNLKEKKVNSKAQGVPQSQAAAKPWHQEEKKRDINWRVQNKQTNARETHRPAPSSPGEVITMLNRTYKHENEEQGMTQHVSNRMLLIVQNLTTIEI